MGAPCAIELRGSQILDSLDDHHSPNLSTLLITCTSLPSFLLCKDCYIRLVKSLINRLLRCFLEFVSMPPSAQSAVSANAETVGTAIGRMAIGLGIGTAGIGVGIGIALGLYYVGRGLERSSVSPYPLHHGNIQQSSPDTPPAKSAK